MTITLQKSGASQYREKVKMLLCGPANVGKTLAAASFPKALVANLRGNMMSVADKGITFTDVNSEDDLFSLHSLLTLPEDELIAKIGYVPETLVVDTIDELQRILVNERLKAQKHAEMEPADWMWLGRKMQTILEALTDLPLHVVFVCHLKDISDGDTGKLFIQPGLQGATTTQIHNYVDYSVALHRKVNITVDEDTGIKTEEQLLWLRTRPDQFCDWLGDKSGKLPTEIDINDISRFYAIISELIAAPDLPKSQKKTIELETEEPEPKEQQVRKPATKATKVAATAAPRLGPPTHSGYLCEVCKKEVESEERAELSKVRFRKVLCNTHFEQLAKS